MKAQTKMLTKPLQHIRNPNMFNSYWFVLYRWHTISRQRLLAMATNSMKVIHLRHETQAKQIMKAYVYVYLVIEVELHWATSP
jgi:hypothetical protein